jgi:hypothetical protein
VAETELERMVLRLLTDVEGYIGPLKEAVQETEQASKSIQDYGREIEKFGGQLQSFGTKISLGVTAPLVAMGTAATYAFGIQEAEEIKLRGILEANERQVESLFEDYTTFASALQQVTTTGDETTLGMLRTAEALGVTGEAAKIAIKESMGLAAAVGMNTRGAIRYTAMLAQGDAMMLQRYIPALRMIEDQEERVAEAHRVLGKMFAVAEAEARSFTGRLSQMWNALGALGEQFGAVIADYLKPFIERMKEVIDWVQLLTPETKQVIVWVAALAASIGPLLVALGTLISLVGLTIIGLTQIGGVLAVVLSPISLLTVAVIGLGTYIVYYSGIGGKALEWLRSQWERLITYVEPAIRGVTDAIKSGQVELAFKIMWAQIQLAWAEGIRPLQEAWVGFVVGFKTAFAEGVMAVRTLWKSTSNKIAEGLLKVRGRLDKTFDVKGSLDALASMNKETIKRIASARDEAIKSAGATTSASMDEIQSNIKNLEKARDSLVKQAKEEREAIEKMAGPTAEEITTTETVHQVREKYVSQGVEAIRRGSVREAILKQEHRIATTGGEKDVQEKQLGVLEQIRDNTDQRGETAGAEVIPANLLGAA